MDENTDNEQPKPENKPSKEPKAKSWLACWLLAALVVLLLAGAGYLWMQWQASKDKEQQLNKEKQQLQQQVDKLKKADDASAAEANNELACDDTPTASMKENIKAALDTQNTAVFSTYTSNPVKFVIAASEKGGDDTPDQAATDMDYTHSATGPWDFSLPAATVSAYDAGFYTDYFDSNTYVGKAASGMVAAFDFNCDGKVKQIFVAADASLL